MLRFFMDRLVQFILVVFFASLLSFVAMFIVTDPAKSALPVGASQEAIDAFNAEHGFDQPAVVQYLDFLSGAIRGDFGDSIWLGEPALGLALEALPVTAAVAIPATLIGCLLGVVLGMLSALQVGRAFDRVMSVVSYLSISLAEFWLAILLIMLFAVKLGWVPSASLEGNWISLILPIAVLAIRPLAHQLQMMRSSMLVESDKMYVNTARSKGLSESAVAVRHMLKNAAIPSITLGFYELSRIFVGTAVAIEIVFAWPGIGRLGVEALSRGDVFLVQAIVVLAASVVGILGLLGDLLSYSVDPKMKGKFRKRRPAVTRAEETLVTP